MDFAQLRDADISTLEALVSPWEKAAEKLETGAYSAVYDVGDNVRSGKWEGEAADQAGDRISFLEGQTAAGSTEADTIKSILEDAVVALGGSQERLNDIIRVVDENPELKISDSGTVSLISHPLTFIAKHNLGALVAMYVAINNIHDQIADCLADARQNDGDIARALRSAANADDDDNLDFNPDADNSLDLPEDGYRGNDTMVEFEEFEYWSGITRQILLPLGDPVAESVALGEHVKTSVERAGGECKLIDGLMVCVGAPDYMYARGGTTFGDTFVSTHEDWDSWDSMPAHRRDDLVAHELYHRDEQWRVEGNSFAGRYFVEEGLAFFGNHANRYEYDAETEGGSAGYGNENPPPEHREPEIERPEPRKPTDPWPAPAD